MLNSKTFFAAFRAAVREEALCADGRTYQTLYRSDEPAFTELVNKTIIHGILADAGLTVQHEYFRIDSVGWEGKYKTLSLEESRSVGLNRHLWNLKAAVEHENNKADWLDELIKLMHIRCPLKVVISYSPCDCRGAEERRKLDYAADCMRKIDVYHGCTGEEFLIILGNGAPKSRHSPGYTRFGYRGYLFDWKNAFFSEIFPE